MENNIDANIHLDIL